MNQNFGTLAHSTTNDPEKVRSEYMSKVHALGKDQANGRQSLDRLAMTVIQAFNAQVFTLDKDTEGKDDVHRVYGHYLKADTKHTTTTPAQKSLKQQESKIRVIAKASVKTTCHFEDVVTRGVTIREGLMEKEVEVRPVYHSIIEMAREQVKQDDALSDEQLTECVSKPGSKEKTLVGEYTRAKKIVDDLIAGNGKQGLTDSDPRAKEISQQLEQRIAALTLEQERLDTLEKAAELGLSLVAAE